MPAWVRTSFSEVIFGNLLTGDIGARKSFLNPISGFAAIYFCGKKRIGAIPGGTRTIRRLALRRIELSAVRVARATMRGSRHQQTKTHFGRSR